VNSRADSEDHALHSPSKRVRYSAPVRPEKSGVKIGAAYSKRRVLSGWPRG